MTTDGPVDPVDVLIGAFERWDHAASVMPKWPTAGTLSIEAKAKEDAIAALGLDSNQFHRRVAEQRRRHIAGNPKGMTVGDAVQHALIKLGVHTEHTSLKEAS